MTTRTAQGLDNTCQPHQSSKPVQYYDAVESKHQHRPDTEFGESNNDDDDDDFMMRIVHGSCQGVFPADGCHLPTCHIADQLDLLMV